MSKLAAEATSRSSADAVLIAAQQVFERFGVRRATVDDVARAAKLSRSSVYRTYATKGALLQAVLDRLVDEIFGRFEELASGLKPAEAVVECFVVGISMANEIPLFGRLMQSDPDLINGVGSESPGRAILESAPSVARILRRCGSEMPDDELLIASDVMLRIAFTYLLNPGQLVDMSDPEQARAFANRYLAPLLRPH